MYSREMNRNEITSYGIIQNINNITAKTHQETKELLLLDTSRYSFSRVTRELDGRRRFRVAPLYPRRGDV